MPIQQTSYLMFTTLQDAWTDLNNRVGWLNIPRDLRLSPQSPDVPFLKLYEAWDQRTSNIYDDQGRVVRPLSVSELEAWTTKLREQEFVVKTLETTYGIRKPDTSEGTRIQDDTSFRIEGEVPWLVRIVAGIGAGYLLYRVLRPRRKYA